MRKINLNYKQITSFMIIVIIFVGSFIFVKHNYFLYKQTIVKITDTEIENVEAVSDIHDNADKIYDQKITAIVKNHDLKGKNVLLENTYSDSAAYDYKFKKGDELFVHLDDEKTEAGDLTGMILDIKRDKNLLPFIWIFIIIITLIGRKQGIYAMLSLLLNAFLLSYALDIYVHHDKTSLIVISVILVILFTVSSLLFVNGFNEKTYSAILSTLAGTFASVIIAYLALMVTGEEGMRYEAMDFLTRPYKMIFLAGLFIGSLGAVMDVAITMSSSVFELYEKNKNISMTKLKVSGMDIGKDIMGTMTNILFFAYISGAIPMLILYLKNASPLGFTLSLNLSLEIARALAGGIGIVLTIPIGLYIAIFFVKRKQANKA